MNRCELITLFQGAAKRPLTARAQEPAIAVIGYLGAESLPRAPAVTRAFRQGLGETGCAEALNVATEFPWAEGQLNKKDFVVRWP